MEQAESVDHCLVHKPKLPYCRVCSHAKMKDVPHVRGAFKRELEAWGDIVTADHLGSHSRDMLGLHGQPHAFTIMDLWSTLKAIYPVSDKTLETTAMRVRDCG